MVWGMSDQGPKPSVQSEVRPFFTGFDWGAFWTAFLISFAVYFYTLAPTVTLEDSGELAVAADHLGVPHPPGYPIWTVLSWLFTRLFRFVTYLGQPNPAWSVGLGSAFFGALATGLSAMLISRSGADMLHSIQKSAERLGARTEQWIAWTGGVVGSLLFAFSPVMWSQSVIVEVYALNAFFLMVVMLLVYIWVRRPSDKLLYITAFLFGLGLTNYQVLLLLLACLVLVILFKDLALFRDFLITGIPYLLVLFLIFRWQPLNADVPNAPPIYPPLRGPMDMVRCLVQHGMLPPIVHPKHFTFAVYLFLNLLGFLLAYFWLPRGRAVALTALCLQLGVAFYGFMPIASEFNPPMNWGYPRTWDGFKHALTRGQYEKIIPTSIFSRDFIVQVGEYLADLRNQFTLPLAILGFLPFTAFGLKVGRIRFRLLNATLLLAVFITVLVLIEEYVPPLLAKALFLSPLYYLSTALILGLLVIGAFILGLGEIHELFERLRGRRTAAASERAVVFFVLLGLVTLFGLYVAGLIGVVYPDPATLTAPLPPFLSRSRAGVLLLFLAAPLAGAGLLYWIMFRRRWLEMDVDDDSRKWIITTLCGFLVMSVVLIVLANPKGDIQDMFIQRVKFISSHGLYALWIGYGLIFALGLIESALPFGHRLIPLAQIGVLLTILTPIYLNYNDPEIERIVGGAEQNGHDFGWQFGNYQLRGADAILEELDPDEEPLPNPAYPPEMGTNAVFFGGTDPGRFVPTYMIYSADVRSDVFLITQNALADNTYMSVMRDLYGDQIYIPSVADGNTAFHQYVEDVQAGRVPANAAITFEGGRVSVQGVAGVMLINGILAKMIFDYNKWRHDFYVEESYVIQWMYPYLTPHGLIMKINREPLPALTPTHIRDDLDFWDWYVRRLTGNRRFQRDVVARKSFSKLRSAIGGLYVFRGLLPEAEQAFREAYALYPLSPEANFRLADLYLRWGRAPDAIRVMESFVKEDPNNIRAAEFINEIRQREERVARARALETALASGKGTVQDALQLAQLYHLLGQDSAFLNLCNTILANTGLPAEVYRRVAQLLVSARRMPEAARAMRQYLDRTPADSQGWIDLAAILLAANDGEGCLNAMSRAIQIGGEEAKYRLRQDPRFDAIKKTPVFQSLTREDRAGGFRLPL